MRSKAHVADAILTAYDKEFRQWILSYLAAQPGFDPSTAVQQLDTFMKEGDLSTIKGDELVNVRPGGGGLMMLQKQGITIDEMEKHGFWDKEDEAFKTAELLAARRELQLGDRAVGQ